jgi:PAS domain S-box-containing protein
MYQTTLKILLIDDDEDDYLIVRDLLHEQTSTRIQLDWVASYAAGLDALTQAQHDAYLVDFRLGEHDGLELIAMAQTLGCSAPLILLTGVDDRATDLRALQVGATDYLVKSQISAPLLERTLRYAVEHTHTLAELRASRERYRLVTETATDAIVGMRLDGMITFANRAAEEIFGHTPDLLINQPFSLLFDDTLPPAEVVSNLLNSTQYGTRRSPIERRGRHANGQVIPLEISVGVAIERGQPLVTCVIRDQSERQRLEEELRQAQKMEAVGRLAGGVAHDFNNVLTAITGYGDLILSDMAQNQPLQRADIEQILQAARRAARLTQQLLAFSRKQVLQPEVVNLNTVIAEMAPMLHKLIGEDILLSVDLCPQPALIEVDPGQIQQVIMNLAVNARDAMPRGGTLQIQTSVQASEAQPASIQLLVQDSGSGMDSATLEHIFEPFFTTKERGKGTGLGLSTVYGIVKQSGGAIQVESRVGAGAIFRILLPSSNKASSTPVPLRRDGVVRGSETVLLVEDDAAVRHLLAATLEQHGYRVLTAIHGLDALHQAGQTAQPIDLLITDVVMPELSGPELAQQLCRQRADLRVIFISGYTDDTLNSHDLAAFGGIFLQKPFLPYELVRKARNVLDAPLDSLLTQRERWVRPAQLEGRVDPS